MLRSSLISALACASIFLVPPADAQRQQADIIQGATSGELAITVDEIRASNAELRARMTGIESDKARLNGKLETLEFLLSESRDQINRMQDDDAELERLITRLEGRISKQANTIAELTQKLDALQPEPAFLSADSGAETQGFAADASSSVSGDLDVSSGAPLGITTNGPTQIIRRTGDATSETVIDAPVQLGPDGQPLPQGTLGTLPVDNALPVDASPLFAEAKSRLLQFDYPAAEEAFRSFLTQFGDDPQAGEAQYWLAEVLFQQKAYPESGAAYTDMIRSYPDDPRAPEALAKLARSMRLVGDTDQACNALNLLPQRYPNASGVTTNLAAIERDRSECDS